jgi:hypothetical protein
MPKELTPRKGWDPFFPPRWRQFSALAMSPSLSIVGNGTPSSLRLAPCDLPKIDSDVAYVGFSTASKDSTDCESCRNEPRRANRQAHKVTMKNSSFQHVAGAAVLTLRSMKAQIASMESRLSGSNSSSLTFTP